MNQIKVRTKFQYQRLVKGNLSPWYSLPWPQQVLLKRRRIILPLVSQSPPVKGQTQYQPKVQVPPGTAFSLEQINGKLADKAVDKKQGTEKSANQRLSTPSGNQKKGDGTSPERPKNLDPLSQKSPRPPPPPPPHQNQPR